jgi:hypothetical protein
MKIILAAVPIGLQPVWHLDNPPKEKFHAAK